MLLDSKYFIITIVIIFLHLSQYNGAMKNVQKAIKKIDFVYFSDFYSQNVLWRKRVHISHFGLLLSYNNPFPRLL